MKGKMSIKMKLHTQLKVKDKLMAAALGSCRKISPTTMKGMGPEIYQMYNVHTYELKTIRCVCETLMPPLVMKSYVQYYFKELIFTMVSYFLR